MNNLMIITILITSMISLLLSFTAFVVVYRFTRDIGIELDYAYGELGIELYSGDSLIASDSTIMREE